MLPHFGSFWSVKFWTNATDSDSYHTFLESRHPEVNENPYDILSPERSQKKLSAHGLIVVVRESKYMEIQKFRISAKPRKFLPLEELQKRSECMKFTCFTDESFI